MKVSPRTAAALGLAVLGAAQLACAYPLGEGEIANLKAAVLQAQCPEGGSPIAFAHGTECVQPNGTSYLGVSPEGR